MSSSEVASCGVAMDEFLVADVPSEFRELVIPDVKALEGRWLEEKSLSQSGETILAKTGVGLLKRKAMKMASLDSEFVITGTAECPSVYVKTYYPLRITKESKFTANGEEFDQPDPDTCNWKTKAVFCNGRLIQKRVGSKGTMFDTRAILKNHPTDSQFQSPIMFFRMMLIEPDGTTQHIADHFMVKK